jgi:hypothetical protein
MKQSQPNALVQTDTIPALSEDQLKKLLAIRRKVAEIVRKMDDYPEPVVRSKKLVEAEV